MNKSDLIDVVAKRTGMTGADAGRTVDAIFEGIAEALGKGDTVNIAGFGSFAVGQRAARTGRNPRTGETLNIAASRAPKFRAGKALKDAVN